MKFDIKKSCSKCSNGKISLKDLDIASWEKPAICDFCGRGFIRLNIFEWPLYPTIDIVTLLLTWIYLGQTTSLTEH